MQALGIVVVVAWILVLGQIATSKTRTCGKLIATVALFGSIALALAAAAGASTRPTPNQLAGLLKARGATQVRCMAVSSIYLCTFTYRGDCVEVEYRNVAPDWREAKAWRNRLVNGRRGRCAPRSSAPQS